jgi:hypothetical protein
MAADKVFPQLSQEIRYVNLFAADMAKYVDAADSECTMIAPDNTVRAAARPSFNTASINCYWVAPCSVRSQ